MACAGAATMIGERATRLVIVVRSEGYVVVVGFIADSRGYVGANL